MGMENGFPAGRVQGYAAGQPDSQPASQPGHSKGHDGGLECERGTGHVAGSQRSLAVASPSCDP